MTAQTRQTIWEWAYKTHIDPATGCWIWEGSRDLHRFRGGKPQPYGHYRGRPAHRVAWEDANGRPIPVGMLVDHSCHQTLCVNPDHLRLVTNKQNLENRAGLNLNNKSGYRGVFWHKKNNNWCAQICHQGKRIHVGSFMDVVAAAEAARAARAALFTHSAT